MAQALGRRSVAGGRPPVGPLPSPVMADSHARETPVPGWYGSVAATGVQVEDPYTGFRELRETQPVNLTPDGTWRLSRYDDVQRLLRHVPTGMRRTDGLLPGQSEQLPGAGLFMLMQDPPNHTRLRKLVSKAFTPRAIEAWRPRVEAVTHERLDRVAAKGEMDLVADLALPVPATLICELMGVPVADRDRFTAWTATATHGLVTIRGLDALRARVGEAAGSLADYFTRLIAARRADPRDDLLSALITAEEEGEQLDELELLSQSIGLLIAGFETTIGLIGNGLTTLIRNPDERARLRAEPGLVESAVEECLRYSGPILATVRVLHADAEFGGFTIPVDSEVVALLAAANRDPAQFDDPERFDVARYGPGRATPPHLSFGGGAHFCLGAHLARLEAQVAIGSLVARFDELTLLHEKTEWGLSLFRVPGRIPVRFVERPA